jgi:hypothetical protein
MGLGGKLPTVCVALVICLVRFWPIAAIGDGEICAPSIAVIRMFSNCDNQ